MVHNAGNQQCCCRIKYADLCSPFYRMSFPGGCCKRTDARHIKADRENKNPRKLDVFGGDTVAKL